MIPDPLPGPAAPRRTRTVSGLVVPAAVSAALVWLLMRGLSWERLAASVLAASPGGVAWYAAITLAGIWLRAVRFRMLLPEPRPDSGAVFFATAVQNALGDLVPARLAALGSYVWLLNKRLRVTAASAASTFIVSFVLDLVTLGPLLLLATAVRLGAARPGGGTSLPLGWTAVFGALFFAVSAAATWWLGPLTRALGRAALTLARRRGDGGWKRIATSLDRVAASMEGVRRAGTLARLLAVSATIRVSKYASLYALMNSLLAGTGHAGPRPDLWDLVIGISATELLASLPVPTIGQFGVWEGGLAGALVAMGFDREPATIVAFGIHGITQIYEYLLGLLALGALLALSRRRDGTD